MEAPILLALLLLAAWLASVEARLRALQPRHREPKPEPGPEPRPRPAQPQQQEPPPRVLAEPARAQAPAQPRLESQIGQLWLVRSGVIMLLIGAALFLRHAFTHGWLGPTIRVALGSAAGLALWVLGVRYAKRGYVALSQGVLGGGSALLYASVFSATALYGLVPQALGFTLLTLVSAATVLFALRYSALALGVLAGVGAFLVPILLGSPAASPHVLCGYLLAVDLGLLVAARRQGFAVLLPLAVVGTWVHEAQLVLELMPFTQWASGFAVLFVAASMLQTARPTAAAGLILATTAWFFLCGPRLSTRHDHTLAGLCAGFGALQILLSFTRVEFARERLGREVLRLLGILLLFAAIPLWAEHDATTLGWTLHGVTLAWLARRHGGWATRTGAVLGLAGALVRVAFLHSRVGQQEFFSPIAAQVSESPFWNRDFGITLIFAAGVAWVVRPRWIGIGLALVALGRETEILIAARALPYSVWHPLAWSLVALAWTTTVLALQRKNGTLLEKLWAFLAVIGSCAACAVAYGFALADLLRGTGPWIANPHFLALLSVPLALLAQAAWRTRGLAMRTMPVVLGAALLPAAIDAECWRWFALDSRDTASTAVTVATGCYALILLVVGFVKRTAIVRQAALALLAAAVGKALLVDLALQSDLGRIASFLALGVVLTAGSWLYHRFASRLLSR